MGSPFGIISLVFGIIALHIGVFLIYLSIFFYYGSLILGIHAIIFGAIGISSDDTIAMAIIGLNFGIVFCLLWLFVV